MSSIYQENLNEIAGKIGISPEDVKTCLYEEVPFVKHLIFERDGVYQKLEHLITQSGNGIFYCLVYKTDEPLPEKLPTPSLPITDYIRLIYKSIYQQVSQHGYTASYRYNNYHLADEAYYENILKKYPDAGLIYFLSFKPETVTSVCEKLNMPLLLLDHQTETSNPSYYSLGIDSRLAIQNLTEKLIMMGHTRIAHISGNLINQSAKERLAGYQSALEKAGIPYNPKWVKYGDWQGETAEKLARELLQTEERPTAIICANDISAMGAYTAIYNAGLIVPDDISVTGFDDIPMAMNCNPPLTTIRQPITEIGRRAGELMIRILNGEQAQKQLIFNELPIIQRNSISQAAR